MRDYTFYRLKCLVESPDAKCACTLAELISGPNTIDTALCDMMYVAREPCCKHCHLQDICESIVTYELHWALL